MADQTNPKPQASQSPSSKVVSSDHGVSDTLCIRYLMGEMDEGETNRFQHRLESEPELCETLVAHSDLIYQLSTVLDPAEAVTPAAHVHGSLSIRTRIAVIAAIAASGLFALMLWAPPSNQPQPVAQQTGIVDEAALSADEDLFLAQAWAAGPLSLALSADDEQADDFRMIAANEDSLDPSDDSVLHWMMAAVAAGEYSDG